MIDKIKEKIYDLLKEIKNDVPEDTSVDLLEIGIIDSFGIAEIIEKLEEEFGIDILGDDIIPENLSSIDNMCKLVSKYKEHC